MTDSERLKILRRAVGVSMTAWCEKNGYNSSAPLCPTEGCGGRLDGAHRIGCEVWEALYGGDE